VVGVHVEMVRCVYGWVRTGVEKKEKRVVGRVEGRGNRRWQQSMTPEAVDDRSKEDVECSCEGSVGAYNLSGHLYRIQ
jgi:hypothetical protein